MAAALLLDLLIFLVPVMLIPLGLWRGGPHEVVVGGGILLGWAVSTEWAGAWGGGLAALSGASADAMSFVVACGLLVVGAGIGHVGGAVLGLPRPEADGRMAGAVLAWLNGVLFLTLALGIYGRQLDGATPIPLIERGFLTRAMIDHQGALLLGIALAVAGLLGVVLWVNAAVSRVYDPTYVPGRPAAFTASPDASVQPTQLTPRTDPRRPVTQPYSTWPTAPRQRPVNVPHDADAGKVEPDPEPSRLRAALSRIGPISDPARRKSVTELFAQSLPVDLRDRTRRDADDRERDPDAGAGDLPRPARPASRQSGGTGRPVPRRAAASRAASERSGDGSDRTSPDQAEPPGHAGPSQSSIGEWLRVASGLTNPMIGPSPADRRAADGAVTDDDPVAGDVPPPGRMDPADPPPDDAGDGGDPTRRRA